MKFNYGKILYFYYVLYSILYYIKSYTFTDNMVYCQQPGCQATI